MNDKEKARFYRMVAEQLKSDGYDYVEKLYTIADSLDGEYPPYGVPIEVHDNGGDWFSCVSAGGGYFYNEKGGPSRLIIWDEWRYKPVDWERVDKKIKAMTIGDYGSISWHIGKTAIKINNYYNGEKILHIDRRPE